MGGTGGRRGGGSMQAPPAGALGQPSATPPAGGGFGGTPSGGFGGAGRLGANDASLTAALAYTKAHGGGTVAVASQDGASASIINSDSNVVAIGGFSGRESQVSIQWFAQQVAAGKIRWVVADSQGGDLPNDSRPGATGVMAAVAKTCKSVTTSSGTTLYDCQGSAAALAALA